MYARYSTVQCSAVQREREREREGERERERERENESRSAGRQKDRHTDKPIKRMINRPDTDRI